MSTNQNAAHEEARPYGREHGSSGGDESPFNVAPGKIDHDSANDGEDVAVVIDLRDHQPVVELRRSADEHPEYLDLDAGLLGMSRWQAIAKRAIDIAGALVAVVILSPVFLLTALAVSLTSRGPVLYRSWRVGQNGRKFVFLKFRSMHSDADAHLEDLRIRNEANGPVFKLRDDPRLTPIGGFIRRYSLDELPQFFHVLSGKMSLVGPRPPIPEEVAHYEHWQLQRLWVKPGITCIWQVSGRSHIDFEAWVRMDLDYISNWSLRQDFVLLARTVPAVLAGRGAY